MLGTLLRNGPRNDSLLRPEWLRNRKYGPEDGTAFPFPGLEEPCNNAKLMKDGAAPDGPMMHAGRPAIRRESNVLESNTEFAALVAAVAERRDRDAFAHLFDHFAPRLQSYLIRLGSDAGMAEEITQDVMVTLWRKAELFDPAKSSLATWLYRIARNRRIDSLRRDRHDYTDDMAVFDVDAESLDVDGAIDMHHREDRVRIAMETLPVEQLHLVRLAFFDGLSHSEIADRTKLPLGTVKSRIRLAFTRLRRTLEADGVVEAG